MNKITHYLNRFIVGNVFDKTTIREAYATDRSILKILPKFVAVPESTDDIRQILKFADKLAARDIALPITVRGGGNDKTGAAIGEGMVLSMEKLNRVQEIDARGRLVRVQAGITLGELNTALSLYGLNIPIMANPKETIGGLIGNCLIDNWAGKYGGIVRFVERAEIILANGECITTGKSGFRGGKRSNRKKSLEQKIYERLNRLMEENGQLIGEIKKGQDLGGYATISLIDREKNFDLLPLMFGSQGTLGVISEVILNCEYEPNEIQRAFVCFEDIRVAKGWLEMVRDEQPTMADLYDARVFSKAKKYGETTNELVKKASGEFVVVVGFNERKGKALRKLRNCLDALPRINVVSVLEDDTNRDDFRELTGLLTGYLNNDTKGERVPVVDDVRIESGQLELFLEDIEKLEKELKIEVPIYGSYLTENYCARPNFVLDKVEGRKEILKFLTKYQEILLRNNALVNGGTPEGRVKALLTQMPENQKKLFVEIKRIFDPHQILNPGVKLGVDKRKVIKCLRDSYNSYIVE